MPSTVDLMHLGFAGAVADLLGDKFLARKPTVRDLIAVGCPPAQAAVLAYNAPAVAAEDIMAVGVPSFAARLLSRSRGGPVLVDLSPGLAADGSTVLIGKTPRSTVIATAANGDAIGVVGASISGGSTSQVILLETLAGAANSPHVTILPNGLGGAPRTTSKAFVLLGGIVAASSLTGSFSLSASNALVGAVPAGAGLAARVSISAVAALVGAIPGAAVLSGGLGAIAPTALAGAIVATPTLSGVIGQTISLGGTVPASAVVGGTISQGAMLAGAIPAPVGLAGTLTQAVALAGAVPSGAALAGQATIAASSNTAWTPDQLGASLLQAWLDPTQGVSSANSTWTDRMNGIVFSSTSMPTYSATALNGKPGLTWTNGNVFSSSTLTGSGTPFTMVCIVNPTSGATRTLFGSAAANGIQWAVRAAGGLILLAEYGSQTNITAPDNTVTMGSPNIITLTYDGTNTGIRVNGTAVSVTSASITFTSTTAVLGYNPPGGSGYFVGAMGDMQRMSAVLTTSQLQKEEGYLAWKYGIQSSLPSSHPYASRAPYTSDP